MDTALRLTRMIGKQGTYKVSGGPEVRHEVENKLSELLKKD